MTAIPPRIEHRTRANGIELAWDSFGDVVVSFARPDKSNPFGKKDHVHLLGQR